MSQAKLYALAVIYDRKLKGKESKKCPGQYNTVRSLWKEECVERADGKPVKRYSGGDRRISDTHLPCRISKEGEDWLFLSIKEFYRRADSYTSELIESWYSCAEVPEEVRIRIQEVKAEVEGHTERRALHRILGNWLFLVESFMCPICRAYPLRINPKTTPRKAGEEKDHWGFQFEVICRKNHCYDLKHPNELPKWAIDRMT